MKTVPGFEKKLSLYALGGAAALAASGGAGASIVYVPVGQTFVSPNGSYAIDPSNSSTPDVQIGANTFSPASNNYVSANTSPTAGVVLDSANTYVAALALNDLIDPVNGTHWGSGGKMINNAGQGPWSQTGGSAYLGFYFTDTTSGLHAGWADISTTANANQSSFTMIDYAYDTVAGEAIKAGQGRPASPGTVPEPASIALLAMGAAGIAAVRRRRAHA